jgi:hypothetical protein
MTRALIAILALSLPARAIGQQPAPPADTTCTDVNVGAAHGYDCLNAQLAAMAHTTDRPSSDTSAPISAASPSNVVGTFNESGTRNRLGANFGKSAQPVRPAQNYVQPLTAGRPK